MAGLRNGFVMIGKAKEWRRNTTYGADLQRKRRAKERRGGDTTRIAKEWRGYAKQRKRTDQYRLDMQRHNTILYLILERI